MSYSHNVEADFAASELARMFAETPDICYCESTPPAVSASATYEPSSSPWPKADGLVLLLEAGHQQDQRHIAVEYKRQQEGIHGLLTGLGQAHAYLHKGYSGTALVVPGSYPTLGAPGDYLKDVLERDSGATRSIGVFTYDDPDTTSPRPFQERLHCIRPFNVIAAPSRLASVAATPKTQWVHMREGSTTRDAIFRFLQTAKRLTTGNQTATPRFSQPLLASVQRIGPGTDAGKYLSSTSDDKLLSRIWREFWFEWLATREVLTPWRIANSQYVAPNSFTRIEKDDGTGLSQIFEGRTTSLKNVLVDQLNNGAFNEEEAWDAFISGFQRAGGGGTQGISQRAHSFREDLDSALVQLELIEPDGHPTDVGYHYMQVCERFGGANSQAAKDFIGATLLQNGHYGSFLHYIYRLSEEWFTVNPLAFTHTRRGQPVFNESSYQTYLLELENKLHTELKVMRKVGSRERPRRRMPFQVELTLLRNYGFVKRAKHRLGLGIPIDWVKVQEAMNREL